MAFDLSSITRGAAQTPPRILIHGVQGVGKTSLISGAPSPIVIQTEDGLGSIDVPAFPLAKSYADVMEALATLAGEDHGFKTVMIDSADWFEGMVWREYIRQNPTTEKGKVVNSIEDYGFGKGYVGAMDLWGDYIEAINYIRNERGMTIIQTCHTNVKRYNDPHTEPYDRYQLKLQDRAAAKLLEHSDVVVFQNYRVSVKETDGNRNRGVGSGERIAYTEERPAFIAKNRFSMPPEIVLPKDPLKVFDAVTQHIPYFSSKQTAQEV